MITTANILVDGYALTVREAPVSRRASIIGQLIAEGCRQLKSAISFTHDMMAEALTAGGCATTRRQVGKAMKRLIGDGRLYAERQGNRWSYLWHETELPDGKGGDFSLELDGAAVVTVNEGRRRAGRPAKNPDGGDDNGRDAWSRRKTAAARERAASSETQPPASAAEDATEAATAPGYAVADDAPTTEWRCPFHPDRKPRPSNTPGYFHCTQPVHFYNGKPTMYCSEQSHYHDADYAARRAGAGNRRPATPAKKPDGLGRRPLQSWDGLYKNWKDDPEMLEFINPDKVPDDILPGLQIARRGRYTNHHLAAVQTPFIGFADLPPNHEPTLTEDEPATDNDDDDEFRIVKPPPNQAALPI